MKKLFFFLILFFFCSICIHKEVFAANKNFAVIGDVSVTPELKNIYIMFGNLGITYKNLTSSQVTSNTVFNDVDAIVSFVDNSVPIPNPTAIINFANDHIVISHGYDFANYYYPSYNNSYVKISTWTVNYSIDWGNFRKNDQVEFQRQDHSLWVFLESALEGNPNITKIAEYRNTHVALFHMKGSTNNNGFYVMDLKTTTNETEWVGIWHIFPAVKMVKDFPTGKYSIWMGKGTNWWDITWINNHIDTLANENSDIAEKLIIGQSLEDRNINAIVIGKGNRYAIIDGCIHGNEKNTAFSSLRIAELLIEYYRSNPSWQTKLNQYKIIIIPVLNPDGFVRNIRSNANSSLSPEIYHRNGSTATVNGSWISHGLPTAPCGIEGESCTIIPQDSNVKGVVFDSTNTKFQVGLTWKSDGSPVTTPTNIKWDCRTTCCNLNRQFPPGCSKTTEPEAWALRDLMNTYKPTIYINNHEGWAWETNLLGNNNLNIPFINFSYYTYLQTIRDFQSLKHWGYFTEGGANYPLGSIRTYLGGTVSSGSARYAGWTYSNSFSTLIESLVWSPSEGSRKSLYGLDYYTTLNLAHLKHYDYDGNFIFYSNGFISSTSMVNDALTLSLDTSELTGSSEVIIADIMNKGSPTEVYIDGVKKVEGDKWKYNSSTKYLNFLDVKKTILINWGESTTSTEITSTSTTSTTSTTTTTTTVPITTSSSTTTTTILTTNIVSVDSSKVIGINNLSLGLQVDWEWKNWFDSSTRKQLTKDADFKLVRVFDFRNTNPRLMPCLSWNEGIKDCNNWNWTYIDSLTQAIFDNGAEPLFALGNGPNTKNYIPPGMAINSTTGLPYPDSWAAYCKEWPKHFKNTGLSVRFYEIINEPWQYFEWANYTKIDNFMTIFNASAQAMRAENPNVMLGFDGTNRKPVLNYWLNANYDHPHQIGADLGFISFHKYDSGNLSEYSDVTILNRAETFQIETSTSYYGIKDARQTYYNARGKWIPVINSESNLNSVTEPGTDPRIQQMVGTTWTTLMLRKAILSGLNYNIYFHFGSSASWEHTNKPPGYGFGMTNLDNNKPYYPYYVHKWIGNNLAVNDSIINSSSESDDIRTLAWINNQILNILLIHKVNQTKTYYLQGVSGQLNYSKIDDPTNTTYLNPVAQNGTIDANDPINFNGYTVMLLQQPMILHVSGTKLLDKNGDEIRLKGVTVDKNEKMKKYGTSSDALPGDPTWFNVTDVQKIKQSGGNDLELHIIALKSIMPTRDVINEQFFVDWIDKWVSWCELNQVYCLIDVQGFEYRSWGNTFPEWLWQGIPGYPDYSTPTDTTTAGVFIRDFFDTDNPRQEINRQAFINAWKFIVNRYKSNKYVLFSIMNEPMATTPMPDGATSIHLGITYSTLMERVIDGIRSTGAQQIIFIDKPYLWYLTHVKPINRNNIVWEDHAYVSSDSFAVWKGYIDSYVQKFVYEFQKPLFIGEYSIDPTDLFHTTYLNTWRTILHDQTSYLDSLPICGRQWHNWGNIEGEYYDFTYDYFNSTESDYIIQTVLGQLEPSTTSTTVISTTTTTTIVISSSTTILTSTSTIQSTTTIELDKEPPKYSNLGNYPDPVIGKIPVKINVIWSDNNYLDTVIIYENSTGSWKQHVCNIRTGCSGEILSGLFISFLVINTSVSLLIVKVRKRTKNIKFDFRTFLPFIAIILIIFLISILLFPEIPENISKILTHLGIITMGFAPQTFTYEIPSTNLNINKVVAYYSYANDTSGNNQTTEIKTFIVLGETTTTIPITSTSTTSTTRASTTITTSSTTTIRTSITTISSTTTTITSDLVAYLKFDENSDSTTYDSSNNGNNGILGNSTCSSGTGKCPIWTSNCHSDSCLNFDGKDDYVFIKDNSSLDITNAITIEAWIYPTSWSSSYPRIVSKESGTYAEPYALELFGSTYKYVAFCLNTGGTGESCTNSSINSISLNQWYHVAGTWNGTRAKIYINGEIKGTNSLTGTMSVTTNNITIGNNRNNNRQFNGTIDEIKIYNRALSEQEIMNEYQFGSPTTTTTTTSIETTTTTTTTSIETTTTTSETTTISTEESTTSISHGGSGGLRYTTSTTSTTLTTTIITSTIPVITTTGIIETTTKVVLTCISNGESCSSNPDCCSNNCCNNICYDKPCKQEVSKKSDILLLFVIISFGVTFGYFVYKKFINTTVSISDIKKEFLSLKEEAEDMNMSDYDLQEYKNEINLIENALNKNLSTVAMIHLNRAKKIIEDLKN